MPLSLNLEGSAKSQLAVSLAALLLNDSKIEITSENIETGKYRYELNIYELLQN